MCTYSCLPTVVPVSSPLFFFSFVVVSLLKLNTLFRYFHLVASFSPMTCAPLVSTRWSLISGLQATLSFHSLSFFLFLFFLVSSSSSCALPETHIRCCFLTQTQYLVEVFLSSRLLWSHDLCPTRLSSLVSYFSGEFGASWAQASVFFSFRLLMRFQHIF